MGNRSPDSADVFFSKEQLKKDLKRKVAQSALSKVAANGSSFALTMVSTIVLARLLTPEDFGLLAMVTAITDFARSFIELGLGTATVQRERITQQEVSALFWINCGVGVMLTLGLISLSPLLVWFYGDARLLHICMVLSSIFVLGGLTVQHRALLERQMRFGYLGAINVISAFLSICVAILLALHGSGVWALIYRDILSVGLYLAGTWLVCGWRPNLPNRKPDVRSSLRFGIDVSGFEIIQYFSRSLDRILLGRFSGATSVGLYSKAFQLAMMPIEQFRMVFWDVGLSPLSALQSDAERFRRFYSKLVSIMTFLYMPLVVFLAIQSEAVIRLLLGEAWLSAAPLFRILAIASFFRPVVGTFQLAMIACGKTRRCILWGLINAVCMIIAFGIGIRWGGVGIAYGYTFVSYAIFIWSLWYCFLETPVEALDVIKSLLIPVISSFGAGIILIGLLPYMHNTGTLASLISSSLIIGIAYLSFWLCIPSGRQKLSEFWSYRRELLRA